MLKYTNPNDIIKEINKYVIGQERATSQLVTFFFNYLLFHYAKYCTDIELEHPPVALLMGESGTGKTHLVKTLCKLTDCHLIELDGKALCQEGWAGTSFKEYIIRAFKQLPKSVDNSVYKIIFIDEFDKLCQPCYNSEGGDYSLQIQSSILKYLEGFEIQGSEITIDLTKCCFILAGNFQGLRDKRLDDENTIGFNGASKEEKSRIHEELEEYGLVPEILGRVSNIIELNQLTIDDYKAIINSDKAFFKQYQIILKYLGIKMNLQDSEITKTINEIIKLRIGVRGLIQELTKILHKELEDNLDKLSIIGKYFNYLETYESYNELSIRKESGK